MLNEVACAPDLTNLRVKLKIAIIIGLCLAALLVGHLMSL